MTSVTDLHTLSGGATFNDTYRYHLWREWSKLHNHVTFVMLNPSTADHAEDDPTMTRCVDFAKRHGFGGLDVVNLFALRSSSPSALARASDPWGPDFKTYFKHVVLRNKTVVVGWGAHPQANRGYAHLVNTGLVDYLKGALCLGMNTGGSPKHPLFVRKTKEFEPWHTLT